MRELEEKISAYRNLLKERGYTEDQNKDAYEILNNAVLHLEYAKENFAKGDFENTKLHISHVKDFLAKLARILEGKLPEISTKAEKIQRAVPIIAANCETIRKRIIELKEFLSSKRIDESDFKIKYDAHLRDLITCQEEKNAPTPLPAQTTPPPANVSPAQAVCTMEYNPVCGANGKTYSNACVSKNAGITIIYHGECKTESEKTETPESISPQPTTAKPAEPTEPVPSTETIKSVE